MKGDKLKSDIEHKRKLNELMSQIPSNEKMIVFPLYTYLSFGFLLAILLPENILLKSSFLLDLVDLVKQFVPSVNSLASISDFPQVTLVFFSLMWVASPFVLLQITFLNKLKDRSAIIKKNVPLLVLLMLAFFILNIISYKLISETGFNVSDLSFSAGRGSAYINLISTNRIMLGVLGSWIPLYVIVITWLSLLLMYRFMQIFLKKSSN
jgi:hypothetical protein